MGATMRAALRLAALVVFSTPWPALADRPHAKDNLLDYVKSRDDLNAKEKKAFEKEIRKRFGGASLEEDSDKNVQITVAKAIISGAIFMHVDPMKACVAAFEGYRGALGYIPPPIAIHYALLTLEGRQPHGRPIDLAFKFPDYYNEEIAPELVAYWEQALAEGKIPDDALRETKEALAQTRVKMRPLLLDKLRVLARLDRELVVAHGARRAEIEHDLREVEDELRRSFSGVARRPEVIDPRKRPYDRLRIQIEDMGLQLTSEDRMLDPEGAAPPRIEVPTGKLASTPDGGASTEPALVEPTEAPPSGPLPPQPRPGDPDPRLPKGSGRTLGELIEAYRRRVESTVMPWLGTPYVWGASTKGVGTDCSGFTRGVYQEAFVMDLPRVSRDQYRVGRSVALDGLRPGDLVFFDTLEMGKITHVGIYRGDGTFAHAATAKGVSYAKLDDRYYRRAYRGARRLLVYPE
jgi:hypothetical protein